MSTPQKLRIAIDGPCAAGKTTIAKLLASKLDVPYIDTGSLYRAIALYLRRHDLQDTDVTDALNDIDIKLTKSGAVCLNGEVVVDAELRTPDIAMSASNISAVPKVRAFLLQTQRNAAAENGCVMEGRDTTTVVMPDADVKFYLTASPIVRAKRRQKDIYDTTGQLMELGDVLRDISTRDYQDMHREVAPLKITIEQVIIDGTEKSVQDVVEVMLGKIEEVTHSAKSQPELHLTEGVDFFLRRPEGDHGTWRLDCERFGIVGEDLQTGDLAQAKQTAVKLMTARICVAAHGTTH